MLRLARINRNCRVVCIHAMQTSITPTIEAFRERWPEANLAHVLDDSLSIDGVRSDGAINNNIADTRCKILVNYAQNQLNANAIFFSCSAFVNNIHKAARKSDVPVLAPTSAAVEKVKGRTLVLSMFEPTLQSIHEEILQKHGAGVQVHSVYIPDALEILKQGDSAGCRDIIVDYASKYTYAARRDNQHYNSILLPMFSMAFARKAVQKACGDVPVYSTPNLAVDHLRDMHLHPIQLDFGEDFRS